MDCLSVTNPAPHLFFPHLSHVEWCRNQRRHLSLAPSPSFPRALLLGCKDFGVVRFHRRDVKRGGLVAASASAVVEVENGPHKLVDTLIKLVEGSDRGAGSSNEEQAKINALATELEQFCVPQPLKNPLIFGEWDVIYSSNPTAPGGYYRSMLGRALLRTEAMVQTLAAPDVVVNKVIFALMGLIGGQVSLQGKLTVLDEKWIQITFESPNLKFGPAEFQYGGDSTVKIAITYVDETLRLGRGSRGTLFIFKRKL